MIDLTRRQFFLTLLASAIAAKVPLPAGLSEDFAPLPWDLVSDLEPYDVISGSMMHHQGFCFSSVVPKSWTEDLKGQAACFQIVEQEAAKQDSDPTPWYARTYKVDNVQDDHGRPLSFDPLALDQARLTFEAAWAAS